MRQNDKDEGSAMFDVDGKQYSLTEMLVSNADDAPLCDWLRTAQVDDQFPALVSCTRMA